MLIGRKSLSLLQRAMKPLIAVMRGVTIGGIRRRRVAAAYPAAAVVIERGIVLCWRSTSPARTCMNERARHDELTRLCREVRSLKEYQQQILGDVQVGLVEPAISELYAWWDYDAAALHRRSEGRGRPAKPRIDLNVIVTTNYRNQMQQRV
jgi:hypothetical protein